MAIARILEHDMEQCGIGFYFGVMIEIMVAQYYKCTNCHSFVSLK
jgi:hypothetical protein